MKLIKKVNDGKVEVYLQEKKEINNWISQHEGKTIEIIYKLAESKRSLAANRYYWKVLIGAWNRLYPDYTPQQIHNVLGEELRKVRKSNEEIELEEHFNRGAITKWKIQGTSEMSIKEFCLYCDRATLLLKDMGGYLLADEYKDYEELKKY